MRVAYACHVLQGDGVAGLRRRGAARGAIALAIAMIALAITAVPALATSSRAEYDDQVNPICQSANTQAEQLLQAFEQQLRGLEGKQVRGKKARRLRKKIDRLYNQLPSQWLAIFQSEFEQLKAVPPAPGDEGLVSDWLGNRGRLLSLTAQLFEVERQLEKLYDGVHRAHSLRAFKRLLKRQERQEKRLEALNESLYEQLESASKIDLELGTRVGATYCVTGATGSLSSVTAGGSAG